MAGLGVAGAAGAVARWRGGRRNRLGMVSRMFDDLDLNQLRTFMTLVHAASFTEAGRRLYRTQSAISHAMRKLERSVGVPLVAAGGRPFRLTDDGRRLFEACERAFSTLDGAMEEIARVQRESIGRIRLGSTVEFGYSILMRHIQPFMEEHPEIEMEFRLTHDLLTPLLRDELDIVIDCQEHGHRALRRDVLFNEEYVVVASPSFRAKHGIAEVKDLAQCSILSLDGDGDWWFRFLNALPVRQRPTFARQITVNHVRAMVVAAHHGMGVALVPRYCALTELAQGSLERLFPQVPMVDDGFTLYQKQSKAPLLRHRLLTNYLTALRPAEFDGPPETR